MVSKHLKETHCHRLWESMDFKQDVLSQDKRETKDTSEHWQNVLPAGPTRKQIDARRRTQWMFDPLEEEALVNCCGLHPNAKDGAPSIQCDAPTGFEGSDLTRLCFAAGECSDCLESKRPNFEVTPNNSVIFCSFVSPLAAMCCS